MPYPYFQDPEHIYSSWHEPIQAFYDEEAYEKCLNLASSYNVDLDSVERVSKYCYYCFFKG